MRFSINHITVAGQSVGALFNLARDLGVQGVEIRNDLPDVVSGRAAKSNYSNLELVGVMIYDTKTGRFVGAQGYVSVQ